MEEQGGTGKTERTSTNSKHSKRNTPRDNSAVVRTPRNLEQGGPLSHGDHSSSNSQVSTESDPTLATSRSTIRSKKTRSLREVYDQEEEVLDLQSIFALFSCNSIYFEEAVKDENWIKAMGDEIESIEKNDNGS